jgi:acylphosphatase
VSGAAPTPPSARVRAVVTGRVQGVGFRYSTQEVAIRLGLGGWVRNLSDGRVELEAEGDRPALDRLLEFLRAGPRMARVDGVEVEWLAVAGLSHPFELRRTF